jgi:chaperonin cofactor prefoldin
MAQHEGSGNKKVGDLFVKEFQEYMREKLGNQVDLTKTSVMTGIFWEVRRRARLMHGMSI